ncbi:MAG: hypothetical protein ABSD74_11935 [Rhizomicrobium sp.]
MNDRAELRQKVAYYRQLASDAAVESTRSNYTAWRAAFCRVAEQLSELADDLEDLSDLGSDSITASD